MMGDSTGDEKEDIPTEQTEETDQDGKEKKNPNEAEIEKDEDNGDDEMMNRENENGGEENIGISNKSADVGDVIKKAEFTEDDRGEVDEEIDEEGIDADNRKRKDDCQFEEVIRENSNPQNEELVDKQNHNGSDDEDDLIDAVSEVNKKAEAFEENKEDVSDDENLGDLEREKDGEFIDNDDDIGDSISAHGSPRYSGSDKEDDDHQNTDLTAIEKVDDKDIESPTVGNRRSSMKSAKSSKKTKTVRVRSSKTVSSIEVDMTRIIRNEDDNDSLDDDDDDAVTRVTCAKSVDFSIPVDEVDEELQRVIDRPGSGRTSMMDNEDMVGLGRAATMNTPVTINDDRESFVYPRSVRTPSRDGMYQHAVNLIQNRCRSNTYSTRSQPPTRRREVRPPPRSAASLPDTIPTTLLEGVPMFNLPNVVKHINKNPFNDQPNSYFYIAQSKPLPMKPMKVWKGYRGNVYFEPMVCRKAQFSAPSANHQPKQNTDSARLPAIQTTTETSVNRDTNNSTEPVRLTSHSAATTRSRVPNGRRTAASGTKSAMSTRSTGRQLSILDKTSVLSRMDYNAAEDIKWISGIESTGTLQVGPSGDKLTGRAYKTYRNGDKHPKLRIRRGLVSHKVAGNNKNSPKFGVSGGRINEDLTTNQNANPTNRLHNRTSIQEHHSVSHSYPADNYQCVDSMTALQQIMKRNDGHGRSKLVHILPSAYGDGIPGVLRTAKGK